MKKFALLSAVAVSMAFTACSDNDIIDIPVNDEPVIFETDNLGVTAAAQLSEVADLAAMAENGSLISVADVTVTNFPSDYELTFLAQVSADDTFAKAFDVPCTVQGGKVVIDPNDLQGVYVENISKGPKQRTVYLRLYPYAVNGEATVSLGGIDFNYGPFALNVKPFPSTLVIEDNYYLLGTINGWSVAEAIKMNHSDKDVYDDPVFTLKVDISAAQAQEGWWWKIVPQSTYATGNWVDAANASFGVAVNGSEDMEGMLVARTATEDCGAGCLKKDGQWLLTINLEEGSYAFTNAIDYLYTPGGSNGWSHAKSQRLFTSDYANYEGYAYLNGEFKISNAADWDHINYGAGDAEGKISPTGHNLSVATPGLYYLHVNTASLDFSAAPITTIGVIGDATPNGWDASTALTPSADFLTWTGTMTLGGGEFKFRANDGWDINLGGAMDNLVAGGSNLPSPGAGTYEVKLDLSTLPYTCTLTKK